jgi:hypothetical protein
MDIVGFPVDSFAAKFVLCTKTKVGLAKQGNNSISGKLGLKQTRRPLVIGKGEITMIFSPNILQTRHFRG